MVSMDVKLRMLFALLGEISREKLIPMRTLQSINDVMFCLSVLISPIKSSFYLGVQTQGVIHDRQVLNQ